MNEYFEKLLEFTEKLHLDLMDTQWEKDKVKDKLKIPRGLLHMDFVYGAYQQRKNRWELRLLKKLEGV